MKAVDALTRAEAYVARMPPAIQGQGGDAQTFKVAFALRHGFALSEGDALGILRHYNERCEPPWKDSDLLRKVQDVGRLTRTSRLRGYLLGPRLSSQDRRQVLNTPRANSKPTVSPAPRIIGRIRLPEDI
jgi:hypothetical protein